MIEQRDGGWRRNIFWGVACFQYDEWKEHIISDNAIVSWFPHGFLLHSESRRYIFLMPLIYTCNTFFCSRFGRLFGTSLPEPTNFKGRMVQCWNFRACNFYTKRTVQLPEASQKQLADTARLIILLMPRSATLTSKCFVLSFCGRENQHSTTWEHIPHMLVKVSWWWFVTINMNRNGQQQTPGFLTIWA